MYNSDAFVTDLNIPECLETNVEQVKTFGMNFQILEYLGTNSHIKECIRDQCAISWNPRDHFTYSRKNNDI